MSHVALLLGRDAPVGDRIARVSGPGPRPAGLQKL